MKDLILRTRAATALGTSLVVMRGEEYQNYLASVINYHYPNLKTTWKDLYDVLTFRRELTEEDKEGDFKGVDLYEWWLTTPTGPKSCSRDIGDLRTLLKEKIQSINRKVYTITCSVASGDEWGEDIEQALLQMMGKGRENDEKLFKQIPGKPTGYACAETLRRLRME